MKNHSKLQKLYAKNSIKQPLKFSYGSYFLINSAKNMIRIALISKDLISDYKIEEIFAISKMTVIDE
jgi:hypothetical protein